MSCARKKGRSVRPPARVSCDAPDVTAFQHVGCGILINKATLLSGSSLNVESKERFKLRTEAKERTESALLTSAGARALQSTEIVQVKIEAAAGARAEVIYAARLHTFPLRVLHLSNSTLHNTTFI
ncbi:hypothetical protein DNTS_033774 [Danionella cerebrum]|uniref:Uncharacterized protein n=1 Tax=Danionella cerebrum TaxID=2873325 RepID=A0A553R335_9TELE|nr:hypothetical protein DNTS_033774 [Danionella translucida]